MTWFVATAIVLVLAAVAAMAAGYGTLAGAEPLPGQTLPSRELTPDDVREARFSTTLRGYRPEEVDALLARVAGEWEQRASAPEESA